jgi:hypothetical protein
VHAATYDQVYSFGTHGSEAMYQDKIIKDSDFWNSFFGNVNALQSIELQATREKHHQDYSQYFCKPRSVGDRKEVIWFK